MRPLTQGTTRYLSPTRSSLNKSKDPTGIKQKISEIDSALNQISNQLLVDQNKTENLEQQQKVQSEKLQKQVLALRQAFDTLADSVMEETEKIRKESTEELRNSTKQSFTQIEQVQSQIHKQEEERMNSLIKTQGVIKELNQQVQILYKKQSQREQDYTRVKEQFLTFKSEALKQYDDLQSKLKVSDKGISKQWKLSDQLSNDLELLEIKQKKNWAEVIESKEQILQLDDFQKTKCSDFQSQIIDLEQFMGKMGTQCRIVEENTNNVRKQLEEQLNELKIDFRDKIDQIEGHTSDIKRDILRKNVRGVEEVTLIVGNDIKTLIDKLVFLEENQVIFKKEILQQLAEVELNQLNKIEALSRQYYTIARENIPSYTRDFY